MQDAIGLMDFINGAPSPYHAVAQAKLHLMNAGFHELAEAEPWEIAPCQGYFLVRGGKAIIAWRMPEELPGESYRIIAAHGDSPVIKLRPRPDSKIRGIDYLTTEIYGSPLLHSWLDRDLLLAGTVFHRDAAGGMAQSLFTMPELRLRVSSLAPHLKKENKIAGVTIDLQKDLLLAAGEADAEAPADFRDLLATAAGIDPGAILSFDACLADTQPAAFIGRGQAFIAAPRLDNLFNTYCAIMALIAAPAQPRHVTVAVIYDSEEIGSRTWTGAESDLLEATLQRINFLSGADLQDGLRAKARSLLLSADMAHAEHPSFQDATDPQHVPQLNKGLAIKSSAKGNYAIGHAAAAWFEIICRDAGLPLQSFMYRCDHGGGSSVGPIISTRAGITGIDVGAPLLSMHSIRELAGSDDVPMCLKGFQAFYRSARAFSA